MNKHMILAVILSSTLASPVIAAETAATKAAPAPKAGPAHHEGKEGPGGKIKEMDTNNDNQVSKDEFTAYHKANFDKIVNERFARMDTNKDGVLNVEDMKAARHKRGGMHHKPEQDGTAPAAQ